MTHAARKDDSLRADCPNDISHDDSQIHPRSLQDTLRDDVPFPGSLHNDLGINPVQIIVHQFTDAGRVTVQHFLHAHGSDGRAGGIQFQTALTTTATWQAIHLYNLMTELASCAADTEMKFA